MKISGFDVELLRLKKEHTELLRYWRNHPDISVFMDYQTFITEEMQMKWYRNLDAARDFYFIISYQHKDIGLIHLSDIHWNKKMGKAGLFIWEQKYWNTQVPVFASLSLITFAFEFLGLDFLEAKVMNKNPKAILYNKALGFKPYDEKADEFTLYKLMHDDSDFQILKQKLGKLMKKNQLSYNISRQEYGILQALPKVGAQMAKLIEQERLIFKS